MELNTAFVERWAGRYVELMGTVEPLLLNDVGPKIRVRGYYARDELIAVGCWKSPRIRSRLESNSEDDVHDITSAAFAAPERLQHRILCLLTGIQVRAATALLTIWRRIGTPSWMSDRSEPSAPSANSPPTMWRTRRTSEFAARSGNASASIFEHWIALCGAGTGMADVRHRRVPATSRPADVITGKRTAKRMASGT